MEFNYPDQVSLGIAYTPIDELTLEFDFWWCNWAEYRRLDIDFSNPMNMDILLPQNFTNSFLFGLGGECRSFEAFPIYFGAAYELTPIPDETVSPTMIDNDFPFLMCGFGYHPEKWPLLPPKIHAFIDFYLGIGWWERRKNNETPPDIHKSLLPGTPLEALEVVINMDGDRANGLYEGLLIMSGLSFGLQF